MLKAITSAALALSLVACAAGETTTDYVKVTFTGYVNHNGEDVKMTENGDLFTYRLDGETCNAYSVDGVINGVNVCIAV